MQVLRRTSRCQKETLLPGRVCLTNVSCSRKPYHLAKDVSSHLDFGLYEQSNPPVLDYFDFFHLYSYIHIWLPVQPYTWATTFADDTVILSSSPESASIYENLQIHLQLIEEWITKCRIKVNSDKFVLGCSPYVICHAQQYADFNSEPSKILKFLSWQKTYLESTHPY